MICFRPWGSYLGVAKPRVYRSNPAQSLDDGGPSGLSVGDDDCPNSNGNLRFDSTRKVGVRFLSRNVLGKLPALAAFSERGS